MNKGQAGQALLMLGLIAVVTGVVGLAVVDDVSAPYYNSTNLVNETVANTWGGAATRLSHCTIADTAITDVVVTNSTTGEVWGSANYTLVRNPASVNISYGTWEANYSTGVNVTYDGAECEYLFDSTLRIIFEYLPILMAVTLLLVAGGWAYMKFR